MRRRHCRHLGEEQGIGMHQLLEVDRGYTIVRVGQ